MHETGPKTWHAGRRAARGGSVAMALVALLVGCHASERVTQIESPVPLPEHWQAPLDSANQSATENWLASLDDAVLTRLVREGLAQNPDLLALSAAWDATAAQAAIVQGGRWPRVDFSASAGRAQYPLYLPPGSQRITQRTTEHELLAFASWEVDVWGRLRAQADAAEADVQAVAADVAGARLSLAATIARLWYALIEAQLQVELIQQMIAIAEETETLARQRLDAGLAPTAELRLARTDLARIRTRLPERQRHRDELARQLETVLGRYPTGQLESTPALPPPPPALPAGLPAELLERRPDLVAAWHRLRAADRRLAESEAARLPAIRLTAAGGTSTDALRDLLRPDSLVWQFAANLTQPLFDAGQRQARVNQSEALTQMARHEYASTALNAFREVEQGLAGEHYLTWQEQEAAQAAEQAEEALADIRDRYRQGLIDVLAILRAQGEQLELQSQHLAVRRLRLDNWIALHLALGGGVDVLTDDEHADHLLNGNAP